MFICLRYAFIDLYNPRYSKVYAMRTYKVYYRVAGKLEVAYVEAKNETEAKLKVLDRFYYASVVNVVRF